MRLTGAYVTVGFILTTATNIWVQHRSSCLGKCSSVPLLAWLRFLRPAATWPWRLARAFVQLQRRRLAADPPKRQSDL